MTEYGIITSFFHTDLDVHGGSRRFPDRLPSHNRYFYEVWAELLREFVGPDVPVIVVNNASPVRPDNFFSHFPNFEVYDNPDVRPHGEAAAHRYNARSGKWAGFQRASERGIEYAAFVEQDVLVGEAGWLAECVGVMKRRGAKLMTFELEDLKWVATELHIAEVDYWLENRLLAPGAQADESARPSNKLVGEALMRRLPILRPRALDDDEATELMLMRQMKALDTRLHLTWEGMRSTRDVHPDPYGVNGVRYMHHRHPKDVLSFLDRCGYRSPSVDRLRSFIATNCVGK